MQVKQTIMINGAPEELYRFWRDLQNLPRFMKHLESVTTKQMMRQTGAEQESVGATSHPAGRPIGDGRSHWVAKAPAGTTVEWDAEITEDRPNELIAWRSLEGADVDSAGTVGFEQAPGGRGTVVKLEMHYQPPAGALGAGIAKLFGKDPEWQVKEALRRFKQLIEIGEVITTEGQPAGRDSSTSRKYDGTVRG
jgi:uncharacterized membrane protein